MTEDLGSHRVDHWMQNQPAIRVMTSDPWVTVLLIKVVDAALDLPPQFLLIWPLLLTGLAVALRSS